MTDKHKSAGKLGGAVRSARKAESSRKNGKLGGRPQNPELRQIMRERGVTRQRAWQILKGR